MTQFQIQFQFRLVPEDHQKMCQNAVEQIVQTRRFKPYRLQIAADPRLYHALADGVPLIQKPNDQLDVNGIIRKWCREKHPEMTRRVVQDKVRQEIAWYQSNRVPLPFLKSAIDLVRDNSEQHLNSDSGSLKEELQTAVEKARQELKRYGLEHCTFGLENSFNISQLKLSRVSDDGKIEYDDTPVKTTKVRDQQ